MRCKSWRPVVFEPNVGLPPNRKYWRMCLAKADTGTRCQQCLTALTSHPDTSVRRALVREENLPVHTLTTLAGDPDGLVALVAKQRLDDVWT